MISGTFINYSKSFINEVKKLYYEIVIKFLLKKKKEGKNGCYCLLKALATMKKP